MRFLYSLRITLQNNIDCIAVYFQLRTKGFANSLQIFKYEFRRNRRRKTAQSPAYRLREIEESTAGNGVTKVYIGTPYTATHYRVGDLAGIYRIYTGAGPKGNKSAVTSFCTITKTKVVKENGNAIFSLQEYLAEAGNKTVFSENELKAIYNGSKNVVMIELLYNGFFEKGNNVTYWQLKNKGLFESHPYNIDYTLDEIKDILKLGKIDVENIIID